MSRRKGAAKRRRKRVRKLTPEQLNAAEAARRRTENHQAARELAKLHRLLEAMRNEGFIARNTGYGLSHWEREELERLNACRAEPLLVLPDSAYEARRLTRYVDGQA